MTLVRPILNFYHVTSTATTITLPTVAVSDKGTFIIFKHTNTGNITISHSVSALVGLKTFGAATSVIVSNAKVVMVTSNGTAWWIYNTSPSA
jgi:hypothetical protein